MITDDKVEMPKDQYDNYVEMISPKKPEHASYQHWVYWVKHTDKSYVLKIN